MTRADRESAAVARPCYEEVVEAHDHLCIQCGAAWRTDCRCARGPDPGGRSGWCPTCRDEVLLLGLAIGADLLGDGVLDGDWDDEL